MEVCLKHFPNYFVPTKSGTVLGGVCMCVWLSVCLATEKLLIEN